MKQGMTLTKDEMRSRLQAYVRGMPVDNKYSLPVVTAGIVLRRAAVLMPLFWHGDDWHLLLTRRSDMVDDHKGQVSFPGGACEPQDTSLEMTALREAEEEIGLKAADVEVLGRLPDVMTVTSYHITPVVGVMPWPYPVSPHDIEVSRVFSIPLSWLADPAHRENRREIRFLFHSITYYQRYEGELLWGISALMTVTFLRAVGLNN